MKQEEEKKTFVIITLIRLLIATYEVEILERISPEQQLVEDGDEVKGGQLNHQPVASPPARSNPVHTQINGK